MREHDDLGPFADQLLQRLAGALDPGGVGDLAVLHRHVEVDPDQHALAPHVDPSRVRKFAMAASSSREGGS